MRHLKGSHSGKQIQIEDKPFATGGEGEIFRTKNHDLAAKIYHPGTPPPVPKLQAMIAAPPKDPMKSQNHASIAWPSEPLEDSKGVCVGYLMPYIEDSLNLHTICVPKTRLQIA